MKDILQNMGQAVLEQRAKQMALAGLGFGLGSYLSNFFEGQPDRLSVNCDAIQNDRGLLHQLCQLETYSHVDERLFRMIIQHIDKLMILEDVLRRSDTGPTKEDRPNAHSRYNALVRQLREFQRLVLQTMGSEHGVTAHYFVKQIHELMQKHLLNILHLCSRYNPLSTLKRAQEERELYLEASRKYFQKRGKRLSFQKWKSREQCKKYPSLYREYMDSVYYEDRKKEHDEERRIRNEWLQG